MFDWLERFIAKLRGLFATGEPFSHHRMLEKEFEQLHGGLPDSYPLAETDPARQLAAIHTAIHTKQHTAICLSGGGIRSASFALGVLQGLARRKLMTQFDYLSTVSGGGYTGGWLSAWLCNARGTGDTPDRVFEQLAGGADPCHGKPEPEPVQHIREYSNYLDPQLGLLSVDVWTLVATVARNLILNWLVLVPFLAAVLLVPRIYYAMTMLGTQDWIYADTLMLWSNILLVFGGVMLTIALVYISVDLPSVGNRQGTQTAFLVGCFIPLLLANGAFSLYWAWSRALGAEPASLPRLLALGVLTHVLSWFFVGLLRGQRKWRPFTWIAAVVSGAVAAIGVWWFAVHPFAKPLARGQAFAGVGGPLVLGIISIAGTLFVGIAASETTDEDREWWSRFGAWLMITMCAWLAASAVIFGGPQIVERSVHWISVKMSSPTLGNIVAALITALTGGIAARTGRESKTGPNGAPLWRKIVFALAAPSFVVMLLVGLATMNVWALRWLDTLDVLPEYTHPDGASLPGTVLLLIALLVLGGLMGLAVAVNKFSLHGMYRNRLIRAFLGASRTALARKPNRFTGFDPRDNLYMSELLVTRRPLHVINMALNLVADNRLAWQERKAESFTVTPLASGTRGLGYRPSSEYGGPSGISLGTAITLSGAAASPNMGYHSSPAVTFLLTLFNARLGAWLGNPGIAGATTWKRSDPVVGAGPLIREMFGRTTDSNPYVYLSDGGHFENLGLYEMVARRCHFVVVSDGGCDGDYVFEDLGNAIRKIRIDLGIHIDFPDGVKIDKAHERAGNAHGAIGVIRYTDVDPDSSDGVLIYLKATLSGDEPVDVANYASAHPDFPHESTTNQWFGESQFESYRMLGLHTIDKMAGDYDGGEGLIGLVAAVSKQLENQIESGEFGVGD